MIQGMTNQSEVRSALQMGIELIGVGKIGSKNCSLELSHKIEKELLSSSVDLDHAAAFLGALWMKGISESEENLRRFHPCDYFADFPETMKEIFRQLIAEKKLNSFQEQSMAEFLMRANDEKFDPLRLLLTAALRIRHAEANEYLAIAIEINKQLPGWCTLQAFENTTSLIQMTNPFDGFDRSLPLLPLIADLFNQHGFNCVIPVAPSSGPKFGYNDYQLAMNLSENFLNEQNPLRITDQARTSYVNLHELSDLFVRWHRLRLKLKKRPFMATLEKIVNPFKAEILITSVFHGGFNDKMLEVAQSIGYEKIIIIFRGVEGSICLSLARSAKILYSYKNGDQYETEELNFNPLDFGFATELDTPTDVADIVSFHQKIQEMRMDRVFDDSYVSRRLRWNLIVYEKLIQKLK